MKISRNSAYATIAVSIIYLLLEIVPFITLTAHVHFAQWAFYLLPFSVSFCLSWITVFVIKLLKHLNEKKITINAFIIFLAYTWLQFIIELRFNSTSYSMEFMMMYSSVSVVLAIAVLIYLTITVFMIKQKAIKSPLLFFVFCKASLMVINSALPMLFRYLEEDFSLFTNFDFMKYLSLSFILMPVAGIYIGKAGLKLLNGLQNFDTAHYQKFIPSNGTGENSTL